jgi:hypothetical protein
MVQGAPPVPPVVTVAFEEELPEPRVRGGYDVEPLLQAASASSVGARRRRGSVEGVNRGPMRRIVGADGGKDNVATASR